MDCKHFSSCGSCVLTLDYQEQLKIKTDNFFINFENLIDRSAVDIFPSKEENYRNRAEFGIFRTGEGVLNYSMRGVDKKPLPIESCAIVHKKIADLMDPLLKELQGSTILKTKLFSIEFMATSVDKVLVTLIYHKKVDSSWLEAAKDLEEKMDIKLIGRSRGVKEVISEEFLEEEVEVNGENYRYLYSESSFTQPNAYVNAKMLFWAQEHSKNGGDLLELYCGLGNFTIPFSKNFDRVLATEISKSAIKLAKEAMRLNSVENINFLRMSSEDFTEALNGVREFTRIREAGVELNSYNFTTIFVDPPRSGLDSNTIELIKRYKNILYISCNPETLKRDLEILTETHNVVRGALFDQFPYTNHLESGVVLREKNGI